ncbi:MAG: hypothetical protein HKN43_14130 [Rhodothermales bacterium]|nr:hypothetical protein [Rhodothermales bacterium]
MSEVHYMTVRNARNIIKRFLRVVFDVREGEYKRALLTQVNIFLIVLVLLIVKPVVNALFLSNVGIERLPVVFVLVAIAAMGVSTIYAFKLGHTPLNRIINSTISLTVSGFVVFWLLLRFTPESTWIYYVFYVTVAIFGVVATSQVWILANLLFTAREATRLFGFIGAGAIGGGITGGYVTSVLAPVISSDNLILLAAGLLFLCLPLTAYIWKNGATDLSTLQHGKRMTGFGEHPIKMIRNSRHLLYLASIVGIGVLVAKLVDYQFSALASASIESADDLAAFFGFWFSTFNVISLVLQLFITRRVVGIYGVGLSLFLLPSALLLGSSLLLLFPILGIGIFVKAADVTLKQSINKSATELLALPIPTNIKNQAKSFIDIFVDSAATGLGGLMLIFMVSGLDLSVRFISLLIVPLTLVWYYFANGVRREYLSSFKMKLSSSETGAVSVETVDSENVVSSLRRVLRTGSETQVLYILNKVRDQHETRLVEDVVYLLENSNAKIRSAALQTLYFFSSPNVSARAALLVEDPDERVKVAAFEYLIEHATDGRIKLIDTYLKHENESINAAALLGLAVESRNNPEMAKLFQLERRIQDKIDYLSIIEDQQKTSRYRKLILRSIGHANLKQLYSHISEALQDPDPEIVDEAIISAGESLNDSFVPEISSFLATSRHRDNAREALVVAGPGIYETLFESMEHEDLPIDAVRWLPKVAEGIPSQKSVSFLFSLIEHPDNTVQINALRSLNTLKIRHQHLVVDRKDIIELIISEARLYLDTIGALFVETQRFQNPSSMHGSDVREARQTLISLLERRLDVILERIFRLLGLKYPPEEIIPIYEGIQSHNSDVRTNAVEYLDNLLFGNLKRLLIPIVETAMMQTISEETIRDLKIEVPTQKQCLEKLLLARDIKVKTTVLFLIGELEDPYYIPLLEEYRNHKNAKVRDFAQRAYDNLQST